MFLPDANGRVDNAGIFPTYPSNVDRGKFLFLLCTLFYEKLFQKYDFLAFISRTCCENDLRFRPAASLLPTIRLLAKNI